MNENTKKWLKTSVFAALGGGIAASLTVATDPSQYHFPKDVGSGKLLLHFFSGAGVTFFALLIRSPLGQRAMSAYKESKEELQSSKQIIANAKQDLKTSSGLIQQEKQKDK